MSKRNLFNELSQGLEEARKHNQGKLTCGAYRSKLSLWILPQKKLLVLGNL